MYDYWELLLTLFIGITDAETLGVPHIDLECCNFTRPFEIVDDIVFYVQYPVIDTVRNEVDENRLLLNFDEV